MNTLLSFITNRNRILTQQTLILMAVNVVFAYAKESHNFDSYEIRQPHIIACYFHRDTLLTQEYYVIIRRRKKFAVS